MARSDELHLTNVVVKSSRTNLARSDELHLTNVVVKSSRTNLARSDELHSFALANERELSELLNMFKSKTIILINPF